MITSSSKLTSIRSYLPTCIVCLIYIFGCLSVSASESSKIPILDCHVHLYDINRPEGTSWINKENVILYRAFLPKHHQPIAKANNVNQVILVQAGQSIPDNQWNLDITAHNKKLYRGVVGNLSKVIGSPDFRAIFNDLCKDPRYVGYRLSGRPTKQLNAVFFRDLEYTAKMDKTVDILLGNYSLADVSEIAKKVPDLKIIINHCGGVILNENPLNADWVKHFRNTAKFKNVYCKISALYGRTKKQPAPHDLEYYKEILDLSWQCFGSDRLVFGSDWPITRTTGDYASVLELTRSYFSYKSPDALGKLFYENAAQFYGVRIKLK